jgi:hypothetical protein
MEEQTIIRELNLNKLLEIQRLSSDWANLYLKAGAVCLTLCQHSNGIMLGVDLIDSSTIQHQFQINEWVKVDEVTLANWEDRDEAAQFGACGIAILLIQELTEFTIVRRARKSTPEDKTGYDYHLGYKEDPFFQRKARLEISGIFRGDNRKFNARVKQKLNQVTVSDNTGFPAYIVVVEFGTPKARVVKK